MSIQKYFLKFGSSKTGLTEAKVAHNRKVFGDNAIDKQERDNVAVLFLRQLGSFFAVTLMVAAAILLFLGDLADFYIIVAVIALNALIETVQRYRSDSIFETLTRTLPAYSLVVRDGRRRRIESAELVAGDVVILTAGDRVPADALIFYAQDFRVDEAVLTGESRPVLKSETAKEYDTKTVIDNPHVVFSGSHAVTGEAHVLVCEVGDRTQIGQIAGKIHSLDGELPIQRNIRALSLGIFAIVLLLSFFVLVVGLVQDRSMTDMFKVAVALFVSAIPESLPVMLTLVLAYGFKRMGEKNVLVRKMQSLDVLGQIDVLALDKTGTITRNQMKVEKLVTADGSELYVTGDGYEPAGGLVRDGKAVDLAQFPDAGHLVTSAVLSSNGTFGYDADKDEWTLESGDPTEVALLVLGQKLGVTKEDLQREYEFKSDVPFNNQSMYHETTYRSGGKEVKFITGAPETVADLCSHVMTDGTAKKKTDAHADRIKAAIKEYASQGYRALATCRQEGRKNVFLGVVAVSDSVRQDVEESVRQVHERDVEILIITGDHAEIALQVARRIGLQHDRSALLTGSDMQNLTEAQLRSLIIRKRVFARVTPQQKLKILEIFRNAGRTVAMTGDGVNDSLALVKADIGIAMGKASSDAAKASSDIVLLDNRFGSIAYGIDEGKNIFSNIKKTVLFLLSTNLSEMFVVVLAITLALPVPLSAIAILWLNIVTDTFLVLGFAFERAVTGQPRTKKFMTASDWGRVIYLGFVMTFVALFVFVSSQHWGDLHARGMTLLVLVVMQWFNVFNIRAGESSVFARNAKINPAFVWGWIVSLALTVAAFSFAGMREALEIGPIGFADWAYAIAVGSSVVWLEELRKAARRISLLPTKKVADLR